jgi:hypothetical protein
MCNKVENGAIILDRIAKGMYLWYIAKYLVALLKEKGSENENLKVIFYFTWEIRVYRFQDSTQLVLF